jgi:hypothetical protein
MNSLRITDHGVRLNDKLEMGQNAAAERIGAKAIIPPIEGMDANYYTTLLGEKAEPGWLIPADEFCSQPAPLRWLIRKWVQRDALIMVHGPSGSGKTYVVLDWCLRIAGGLDSWCGQKVRNGTVVYLAGEGHFGLRARIAAWKQHHGVKNLDMFLSSSGCDLNTSAGYQRVVDHVRSLEVKPSLIVVDTLHRFLLGDENSAQDAKTMLDACAALMEEFGCSVLLIHHTGLSDEHRARGSSAWRGALDIEINIMPGRKGEPFQVCQRKMKDDEEQDPINLRLLPVPIDGWLDEDGNQVSSCVVVQSDEAPEKHEKVDAKLAEFRKLFERAWFASECKTFRMQDETFERPYVSRIAMKKFLVENEGTSETAADQMMKGTLPNRFIGKLQNDCVIECVKVNSAVGWVVIDNTFASVLLTRS